MAQIDLTIALFCGIMKKEPKLSFLEENMVSMAQRLQQAQNVVANQDHNTRSGMDARTPQASSGSGQPANHPGAAKVDPKTQPNT